MSIPERFKYPFDKTGESPDNLVYPETREVTKKIRTIVPKEGLFFTKSMVITFNGKQLVKGVDFKPTFLSEKATVRTNKEVCGGVRILNDKVIGNIVLRYQVVGDEFTGYSETNKDLIAALDGNNGAVRWEQIINIPEAFIPTAHLHHVNDLIGITPAVLVLQEIKRAIDNLRSHRNVAIYRLIGSIHTRVNNFIDNYTNNDNTIRDTLEEIKQRVGKDRLVSEPVFNLAKRALDTRMDEVERKTTALLEDVAVKNREVADKVNATVAKQNELNESQNTLVQRMNRLTVTAAYTGSKANGQFITVNKQGDGWVISQDDPAWLTELTSKMNAIEANNEQKTEKFRLLDERVTNIENEIPNFRTVRALAEENAKVIATNKNLSDSAIGNLQESISENVRVLQGRLNDNNANLLDKIDKVSKAISPAITEVTNPLAERIKALEIGRVEDQRVVYNHDENIRSYIESNDTRVAGIEAAHAQFSAAQTKLSNDILKTVNEIEFTPQYTGTRENGSYITVDKAGNKFKLKYADPGWLTTLESGISALESKATQFNNRLEPIENAFDTFRGKIDEQKNASTGLTNRVAALEGYRQNAETLAANLQRDLATERSKNDTQATKIGTLETGLKKANDERTKAISAVRSEIRTENEAQDNLFAKYKETVNDILEDIQTYLSRADGPYLKTVSPKTDLMPEESVDVRTHNKVVETHEPYIVRETDPKIIHPKITFPYSTFQPLEIGVEVRILKQEADVRFGFGCLRDRDPNGEFLRVNHVSIDKNATFELVSIRETETGYVIDVGGNALPEGMGIIIYPKTGLDYEKADSFTIVDYHQFHDHQGQGGVVELTVDKHLKVQPDTKYLVSTVSGDFASNLPLIEDGTNYQYTDGSWKRISMRIPGGWWKSETLEWPVNPIPFAGTKFIVPTLVTIDTTGIEFRNFYVRPVDEELSLEKIPGVKEYLDKWLKKKIIEEAQLPKDSRWDLSRFRIQPGAEAFSSVSVDDNDNLEVKGVVYYDTVGKGKRGIFAPTTEITVTETKTWKVPDEYENRVALITVRADSRREVNKVIHSCVRQVMVTLTGGTEIPIQVGDISSFGTHVTVSNAIDYPDAIVGRIESPSGSRVNPGVVSIKV